MRKRKIKYTPGNITRVRVVKDFLAPGSKLVLKDGRRLIGKSDFKTAATKPLPSGDDPDDAMEEIDWATAELPMPPRKVHATMRLDADVLDWFRAQGKGYQTRINAILRKYFEQQTR